MQEFLISSMLSKADSNLTYFDILGSQKFLQQNGYQPKSFLGCGSFGAVMLVKRISAPHIQQAIKLIYVESEEDIESYIAQFQKLSEVKSPKVVNLSGLLVDIYNSWLYIVMDYFPNGNLQDYIHKNPHLSTAQIAGIFIKILEGLQFLEENSISHRNLKLQNILISSNGSPILTDFGLDFLISGALSDNTIQKRGTLTFNTSNQEQQQIIRFESDFEAAGMILFNLCQGNVDISEILEIQKDKSLDISQQNHQELLQISMKMIKTSSSEDQLDSTKTIISQLQELLESGEQPEIIEEQKPQELFEMQTNKYFLISIAFFSYLSKTSFKNQILNRPQFY